MTKSSMGIYIDGVNHLSLTDKKPYKFEGLTKQVSPGDTYVSFSVKLKAGPTTLHTWFDDDKRKKEVICSAYYVYVRKK